MKNLIKKVTTGGFILVGLSSNTFAGPTKTESEVLRCNHSNFMKYIYDKGQIKRLIEETRRGCQLERANLKGADLKGADLKGANLKGANLYGANLSKAELVGANLKGVNLSYANLYGANLDWADLSKANLKGADLSKANLSGANLKGAIYDDTTTFPFWFLRIGKGLLKDCSFLGWGGGGT